MKSNRYKDSSRFQTALMTMGLLLAVFSCKRAEQFPDLGTSFANPADVGVSDDGQYFYVLNSDFDRTYNKGSILVLSKEGQRISVVETPRLGRSMAIAGNDMIVTYNESEVKGNADPLGSVELYDLTDPKAPRLARRFDGLKCQPLSATLRKGYKYFAVSCLNDNSGAPLLVGELGANRGDSTLNLVREFASTRRALHIDPVRNLLFGFVTDMAKQNLFEEPLEDTKTVTDSVENSVPDEIPDKYQVTAAQRAKTGRNETYQFFVYDLAAEAAKGFPYKELKNAEVRKELRWLYFCLSNFDGTPDPDGVCDGTPDGPSKHLYRTNFWESKADPNDGDSFFLSHRGIGSTLFSNDVVKVTFTGDPRLKTDGSVPRTDSFFKFERVYGFPGEVEPDSNKADLHYPGDLEVVNVSSRPMLVVNHFRDLVYWKKGEIRFGMTAKVLGENYWFSDILTDDPGTSYYQVAVAPDGKAVSCSFYGNTVLLMDIAPGADIKVRKID